MKIYSDIIILGSKSYKGIKSYGCLSNTIINNKTLIDIQISNIKKCFRTSNIFYIGEHRCSNIQSKYKITYVNNSNKEYNNLFAISLIKEKLKYNNPLLIFFNKTFFYPSIFDGITKDLSYAWCDKNSGNDYRLGLSHNNTGQILNISYDLQPTGCGVYFLNKVDKQKLLAIIDDKEAIKNMFLFEGINKLIDNGSEIFVKKAKRNNIVQLDSNKKINYIKNKRIVV